MLPCHIPDHDFCRDHRAFIRYIQFSILDPDLGNRLSQLTIEQAEQMMQKFGAPQDQIDQQIEKLSVDMPKRFSVMGQVKTFLHGNLAVPGICRDHALIVRKREPELKLLK